MQKKPLMAMTRVHVQMSWIASGTRKMIKMFEKEEGIYIPHV